jgi:hypothetical protein
MNARCDPFSYSQGDARALCVCTALSLCPLTEVCALCVPQMQRFVRALNVKLHGSHSAHSPSLSPAACTQWPVLTDRVALWECALQVKLGFKGETSLAREVFERIDADKSSTTAHTVHAVPRHSVHTSH